MAVGYRRLLVVVAKRSEAERKADHREMAGVLRSGLCVSWRAFLRKASRWLCPAPSMKSSSIGPSARYRQPRQHKMEMYKK